MATKKALPRKKVRMRLVGKDGNAFFLLGAFTHAARAFHLARGERVIGV